MTEDKIVLEGIVLYGYHGVSAAEKELGQRFVVDVELSVDLAPAAGSDNLALTVNYSTVYKLVKRVVQGPSCDLIETVAERIASAILAEHDKVEQVRVKVAKPDVPIAGSVLRAAAGEITRRR